MRSGKSASAVNAKLKGAPPPTLPRKPPRRRKPLRSSRRPHVSSRLKRLRVLLPRMKRAKRPPQKPRPVPKKKLREPAIWKSVVARPWRKPRPFAR